MLIRLATPADLPAINDLYNHYVLHSTCTFQEEPSTLEERTRWFTARTPQHPVTVALDNDQLLGWAALSPFHPRSAYRFTVENSVYVHHHHHRRGVGRQLLADLLTRAHALGHRSIIAIIAADQTPSLTLHENAGFTRCAHLRNVGFKFEKWLDVIYMQRLLGSGE